MNAETMHKANRKLAALMRPSRPVDAEIQVWFDTDSGDEPAWIVSLCESGDTSDLAVLPGDARAEAVGIACQCGLNHRLDVVQVSHSGERTVLQARQKPSLEAVARAARAIGEAMARDVLADDLDQTWTGLDAVDGDPLLQIGLANTDPEWAQAEQIARASYEGTLLAS